MDAARAPGLAQTPWSEQDAFSTGLVSPTHLTQEPSGELLKWVHPVCPARSARHCRQGRVLARVSATRSWYRRNVRLRTTNACAVPACCSTRSAKHSAQRTSPSYPSPLSSEESTYSLHETSNHPCGIFGPPHSSHVRPSRRSTLGALMIAMLRTASETPGVQYFAFVPRRRGRDSGDRLWPTTSFPGAGWTRWMGGQAAC